MYEGRIRWGVRVTWCRQHKMSDDILQQPETFLERLFTPPLDVAGLPFMTLTERCSMPP